MHQLLDVKEVLQDLYYYSIALGDVGRFSILSTDTVVTS